MTSSISGVSNTASVSSNFSLTSGSELHFYPGQNLLVLQQSGTVLGVFDAAGGPSSQGTDPYMPEEPTTAGSFVIGESKPYHTPTWPMSKIDSGTRLMDKGGDVWYELPSGKWGSVQKDLGVSRDEIKNEYEALYGVNKVPDTWVFNDFGPKATRWFKDSNGDGLLNGSERYSGQMFHTTPVDEALHARGKSITLESSHGCIHIKPEDRDKITALGGFQPGTQFIIHDYSERYK
jgi:hypothetical protein